MIPERVRANQFVTRASGQSDAETCAQVLVRASLREWQLCVSDCRQGPFQGTRLGVVLFFLMSGYVSRTAA